MSYEQNRKKFAINFAIAGIALTLLAFVVLMLLVPLGSLKTIIALSFTMFGTPCLIASVLATITEKADLNSLKGMTIGLLVVSVLVVLYSVSIVIFYNGTGANIGGLAGLLLSPICYCFGGYLGWKSKGRFWSNTQQYDLATCRAAGTQTRRLFPILSHVFPLLSRAFHSSNSEVYCSRLAFNFELLAINCCLSLNL